MIKSVKYQSQSMQSSIINQTSVLDVRNLNDLDHKTRRAFFSLLKTQSS